MTFFEHDGIRTANPATVPHIAPVRRELPLNRDMDLVRRILTYVRDKPTLQLEQINFPDVADEVLGRHVEALYDEGFIEGRRDDLSHLPYARILVKDLTWSGQDFAGILQNEGVWHQMKQKFSPADLATVPLNTLKSVGISLFETYLKAKLGL